jgi:hypothetical protein
MKGKAMQFLFNELKPKGKYHHWGGYDTGCRMWTTGGIKRDRPGWRVVATPPAREICHMCREAAEKAEKPVCGKSCACLTQCGDYYASHGLPEPKTD